MDTITISGNTTLKFFAVDLAGNAESVNTQVYTRTYELITSSSSGGSVTTPGEETAGYDAGTVVNLTATPETGYHFVNWTGDVADADSATTTVTMDGDKSVTANFEYLGPTDVPMVTTGSPAYVTANSAILNGTVNPNGGSTTVVFEYGTDGGYGRTVTATESPLTGNSSQSVSADLFGLLSGTTYHFRAKATNSEGTAYGEDKTFETTPVADIAIVKTVNNPKAGVNEDVTFTLIATNNGPMDATGVEVVDLLPPGLTYVGDDSEGFYDPGTGIWDIGEMANGDSATLIITATVVKRGKITNTAEVTASTPLDPNLENDLDTAIINNRIAMPWIPLLLLEGE